MSAAQLVLLLLISALACVGLASSSSRDPWIVRTTTGGTIGANSVSGCGPSHYPLHLAMPRGVSPSLSSRETIEESLSTAFLGLFTDDNNNNISNNNSNKDVSVSVFDAERQLEVVFSRSRSAQETLCVLAGRRYFLLNPAHNRDALSLLVCHRFVLRRGEAVLVEIRSATSVGVHCQRLSPSAALPLRGHVHAKDADQWLNSAIASLYETHRLAGKTESRLSSPLLMNSNNNNSSSNEPTSFPSARPTLCTDEPTSRPTAIPSITLNAPPHIIFNQTDDDGGTAVGLAAAEPVYETPTFYYTVAFGGAFCVGVVASIAYCLFRKAQNFIKVPFAPPELAMSI